MELLKKKILSEGSVIGTEIVKVDGFINHGIDTRFLKEIGAEFKKRFADAEVNKILTVEASGIAISVAAAEYFDFAPVVFAKKTAPNTMIEDCYTADCRSFTKGTVSTLRVAKKLLKPTDKVLIIDDFLAHGEAGLALCSIVKQAGAQIVGLGAVIEKKHQGGSERLRNAGCRVESLAVITKIENGSVLFE